MKQRAKIVLKVFIGGVFLPIAMIVLSIAWIITGRYSITQYMNWWTSDANTTNK